MCIYQNTGAVLIRNDERSHIYPCICLCACLCAWLSGWLSGYLGIVAVVALLLQSVAWYGWLQLYLCIWLSSTCCLAETCLSCKLAVALAMPVFHYVWQSLHLTSTSTEWLTRL